MNALDLSFKRLLRPTKSPVLLVFLLLLGLITTSLTALAQEVEEIEAVTVVPPIDESVPFELNVSGKVKEETVNAGAGGTLALKVSGAQQQTGAKFETVACPEGQEGAGIKVTGFTPQVTITATFTGTGAAAPVVLSHEVKENPKKREATATVCEAAQ